MWFVHSVGPLAPKQRDVNCLQQLDLDLARTPIAAAGLSHLSRLLSLTRISSFVLMSV